VTVTNAAGIVYNRGHRAKSAHSIEKFPLPIKMSGKLRNRINKVSLHVSGNPPYQALLAATFSQ